jgi:hypothetical protein
MNDDLYSLLVSLDGIRQSPKYHPEGDALFHSLQVFDLARRASPDRIMWAAALFHDVGKAVDSALHDEIGADLLLGLLPSRAVWLVRHHLDLLKNTRSTRRRLRGTPRLRELESLRRFDLGGRDPRARVLAPEDALTILFADEGATLLDVDADADSDDSDDPEPDSGES